MKAELKFNGKTDTVVFSESSAFAGVRMLRTSNVNQFDVNADLQMLIPHTTVEEIEYPVSEDIRIIFYIYSFPDSPETTKEILRYKGMILTEVTVHDIGLSIKVTL